jgi:hypothetical protein
MVVALFFVGCARPSLAMGDVLGVGRDGGAHHDGSIDVWFWCVRGRLDPRKEP